MDFRTLRPEELQEAFAVAGEEASAEHVDLQQRYPDLFLCCVDGDRLVGMCVGWPIRYDRTGEELLRLYLIAFLAEYQRQGHGSRLLREWENRVRARGAWTIDLGSGADGFYLKHGYTAVEYGLKVPRVSLPVDYRERGFEISFLRDPAEPGSDEVCLYSPVGDRYDAGAFARLQQTFGATSSFTIFRKRVGGDR